MLIILFIIVLSLSLLVPPLFPSLALTFFAPFLIISYYKKPMIFCLWLSLICGTILDLLAPQHRLGLYALNYCLTTWLIYNQKQNFFEDSLSTLPIMTLLFSVLSTLLQVFLLYLFEKGISISWEWVGTDLVILPLLDAAYAFVCFTTPLHFFERIRQKRLESLHK